MRRVFICFTCSLSFAKIPSLSFLIIIPLLSKHCLIFTYDKSIFLIIDKKKRDSDINQNLSSRKINYLLAEFPAILPNVKISATALPPSLLPAWIPPVTSPAAHKPGITFPFVSRTSALVLILKPPIV